MSFFRAFLFLCLLFPAAPGARADGVRWDAPSGLHPAVARCTAGTTFPGSAYALLHAGSGPASPGYQFAGAARRRLPETAAQPGGKAVGMAARAAGRACAGRFAGPAAAEGLLEILENVAARDGTVSILRTFDGDALRLEMPGGPRLYRIPDLHLANGILRHRDGITETELGRILALAMERMPPR